MILLIDNYDSFSYNLYQLAGSFRSDIRVIRNDELDVAGIDKLNPDHIILSPGPGYPSKAGVCEDVIRRLGGKYPILGVCLGHQAICEAFGAEIIHAREIMHGKSSIVSVDTESRIFRGLNEREKVARYHSLIADPATVPDCLKIISTDDEGEIMAVEHRDFNIFGLQFHPESILTDSGRIMMENFLSV